MSVPGELIRKDGQVDWPKLKSEKVLEYDKLSSFLNKKLPIVIISKEQFKMFLEIIDDKVKKSFANMLKKISKSNTIYALSFKHKNKLYKILYTEKTKQAAYLRHFITTKNKNIFDQTYPQLLDKSNFINIVYHMLSTGDTKTPAIGIYRRQYLLALEQWHPDIVPKQTSPMNFRKDILGRIAAVKRYDNFRFFNGRYKSLLAAAKAFVHKQERSPAFKQFAERVADKPAGDLLRW